ncbi:MAG: hypothetical protein JF598_31245, partial [Streptomyces sp.]|nr:hypothetical protein [Streptomyces sp.]
MNDYEPTAPDRDKARKPVRRVLVVAAVVWTLAAGGIAAVAVPALGAAQQWWPWGQRSGSPAPAASATTTAADPALAAPGIPSPVAVTPSGSPTPSPPAVPAVAGPCSRRVATSPATTVTQVNV